MRLSASHTSMASARKGTVQWRCHRRFIAELLAARRYEVLHLLGPHEVQRHRLLEESAVREGKLYVCGEFVA